MKAFAFQFDVKSDNNHSVRIGI